MKHLSFACALLSLAIVGLFANAAEHSLRGIRVVDSRDLKGATKRNEEYEDLETPKRHHIKPKQRKPRPRRQPRTRPKPRAPKPKKIKPNTKDRPKQRRSHKRKIPEPSIERAPKTPKEKGNERREPTKTQTKTKTKTKTKYNLSKDDGHQHRGNEPLQREYHRPNTSSYGPYWVDRKTPKVKYSNPEYYIVNEPWHDNEDSWRDEYGANDEDSIDPTTSTEATVSSMISTVPSTSTSHFWQHNHTDNENHEAPSSNTTVSPENPLTITEDRLSLSTNNTTKPMVSVEKTQSHATNPKNSRDYIGKSKTPVAYDDMETSPPSSILINNSSAANGNTDATPPISILNDGINDYGGKLLLGGTVVVLFGGASILCGLLYYKQNRPGKDARPVTSISSFGTQSGSSMPTSGEATAATVDYDYPRAFCGTVNTSLSDVGATVGSQTRQTLPSCNNTFCSEDPTLFSDQVYDDMREELLDVYAPAGKLGVIIDTPDDGAPAVHAIKDTSPVSNKIQVGDKLVALDDEDIRAMSAMEVSKLISRKIDNATRKLTIIRRFPGNVTMESI